MQNTPEYIGFYLLSRIGFEAEIAAECNDLTAQHDLAGYVKAQPQQAYATFYSFSPFQQLPEALQSKQWIFARQCVPIVAELTQLDINDRLSPILAQLNGLAVSDIVAETPDTNQGKSLSGLARGLTNAARQALKKAGQYQEGRKGLAKLHLLILATDHILVGLASERQASRHPGGILHLKLPKNAPSRAILKLEEAAISLMYPQERQQWMRAGITAVDLGAAPGGWTWWLTQQQIHVFAVDNANMSEQVMQTGLVEHIRADGFIWRPKRSVHWICCDMVEQPQRVAELIATWLDESTAQMALFNLKLPMKKRYAMIQDCLGCFAHLQQTYEVRAKHLYHDREEITLVIVPRLTTQN